MRSVGHGLERSSPPLPERFTITTPGPASEGIVTEIVPYQKFYEAEESHQDYFALNGQQPYCQIVIEPKIEKFLKEFGDRARD